MSTRWIGAWNVHDGIEASRDGLRVTAMGYGIDVLTAAGEGADEFHGCELGVGGEGV